MTQSKVTFFKELELNSKVTVYVGRGDDGFYFRIYSPANEDKNYGPFNTLKKATEEGVTEAYAFHTILS